MTSAATHVHEAFLTVASTTSIRVQEMLVEASELTGTTAPVGGTCLLCTAFGAKISK